MKSRLGWATEGVAIEIGSMVQVGDASPRSTDELTDKIGVAEADLARLRKKMPT